MTNEDILNVRIQTTEITENLFNLRGGIIVFDVGGQRGLRKQWMPYFDFVHSIVFVADISCFDQVLVEDVTVNRMADALDLFESICNAPLLKNISMVLLLNKMDVLHKKLKHTLVSTYFPDFKGWLTMSDPRPARRPHCGAVLYQPVCTEEQADKARRLCVVVLHHRNRHQYHASDCQCGARGRHEVESH